MSEKEFGRAVVTCPMCGTVYPFGWEHRCGAGGVVVAPPTGREGDLTPDWLKENLPREWNYRIHVRGVGGVAVHAWDYEAPEIKEFTLEAVQVDPRETADDRDIIGQIILGLKRIALRDHPTEGDTGESDG